MWITPLTSATPQAQAAKQGAPTTEQERDREGDLTADHVDGEDEVCVSRTEREIVMAQHVAHRGEEGVVPPEQVDAVLLELVRQVHRPEQRQHEHRVVPARSSGVGARLEGKPDEQQRRHDHGDVGPPEEDEVRHVLAARG